MALNTNYTRLTYQELIEDFENRLRNDPRFKKLTSAAIYNMFMEMLSGTMDMTNFFMQRTAEECFIDTARLESSIIKHGKTLGYNPKRPVPAQAEISITIKGPLPEGLKAGATVYFAQSETNLSFNNKKYILSTDYSYTFDETDIENGKSSTWTKTIYLSKSSSSMKYMEIAGTKEYSTAETSPIIIYQGEFRTIDFDGTDNIRKLGKNYQYYDINDITFSDWYGKRDFHTYKNGRFFKDSGYTKVGIGKTETEAFKNENLYEIEDYSIYINDSVLKADSVKEPLNVCQMVSNQDKTIRLQFGDGEIVSCGLKTSDDKIYVQYFSTEGAIANAVGTSGSMLNSSSRFFATQQGAVIDITSNIQFLLESNIYGGADFEDSQSIKNNAPKYYASCDRLITKQDFVSWFNRLTKPLNVKNSIVMGQEGVEQTNAYYPQLQNFVLYYITTAPYIINGKENTFKNPFIDDPSVKEPFTLYGTADDYFNHLVDYARLITNFDDVFNEQYQSNPTKQCFKDIKSIRELTEDKMAIDSKILSMPPIVHLYDVYGTVEINSLANLQQYKLDVENDVYKWLNEHTTFNSPIYKSDIIKIFNQKENTKYADLDIRVSQLIYENVSAATISAGKNKSIIQNGFQCRIEPHIEDEYLLFIVDIPKDKYTLDSAVNGINTLDIQNSNTFKRRIVKLTKNSIDPNDPYNINKVPDDTSEEKTVVHLFFKQYVPKNYTFSLNTVSYLSMVLTPDTLSSQSTYDPSYMGSMIGEFASISVNREKKYIATVNPSDEYESTKARYEELSKKVTGEEGMTEKKFWQKFITEYFTTAKKQKPDVPVEELVKNAVNAYKFFKPSIEDSVLDDNNNIVNYSLASEMPIIRLNITYKYRN